MANEQGMPDLNAVLNNPELMAKVRSIAESLSAGDSQTSELLTAETAANAEKDEKEEAREAGTSPRTGVSFPGFAKQDVALLKAIAPYLTPDKRDKLNQVLRFLSMAQLAQGMKDKL